MREKASLFDFHPLHSDENKKIIGKFKDEMCGQPAFEFVGLKAMMYSIKSSEGEKKGPKEYLLKLFEND